MSTVEALVIYFFGLGVGILIGSNWKGWRLK